MIDLPRSHTVTVAFCPLATAHALGATRDATAELGLRVKTSLPTGTAAFLRLAPLCMLVAAAQLALGLFSKTAKEAQETSMVVSFVPVVFGFVPLARPALDVGAWVRIPLAGARHVRSERVPG
jgi:hypothetical protein